MKNSSPFIQTKYARIFSILLLTATVLSGLHAESPIYIFTKKSIMYMETNVIYNLYVNGEFIDEGAGREISYFKTISSYNKKALLSIDTYYMQRKENRSKKGFVLTSHKIHQYTKDNLGKTEGLSSRIGLNDLLRFPEGDLQPGDDWALPAIWQVAFFNPGSPSAKIELDVHYRYIGTETINDKEVLLISANAVFAQERNKVLLRDARLFKLAGFLNFLIKFNVTEGRIHTIDETFDLFYILHDGTVVEMSGTSSTWTKVPPPPVEDEFISEKLRKNRTIRINKRKDNSLSITLDRISFKPDSDLLLQEEKKRLDTVADTLVNYRFNHIIIIGHTADIGRPAAQQALSENRARVVVQYLINKHHFNPDLLSYQGKGATEPIADNSTNAGKAMNRRVEIIILPR